MKKWMILICILAFSLSPVYAREAPKKQAKTSAIQAKRAPQPKPKATPEKEDPFKALMVIEAETGKVLEEENIHLRWPPASITKMMVSSVVMEKLGKGELQFTDKVPVSKEASRMGGSQVFLKEGETFTLEEMMMALMIASANDAAYAIGEFVAGSSEAFIRLMNEKAKALGMVDTEYHSIHGLPPSAGQEEDLTSCHDLAILARDLLKYPKLLEWTSTQTAPFRDGTFIMKNHNNLLGRMTGIDGIKTGYYQKAGYNVVVTAKRSGLRLIAIVLGSPRARVRDNIAEEKLKKYFSQYTLITILNKGEEIDKEVLLPEGERRSIKGIADATFSYPVPNNKKSALKKEFALPEKVTGEVTQGQRLGEVLIRLDNEVIGKVDIVSPSHVPRAGFFKRLFRKLGLTNS